MRACDGGSERRSHGSSVSEQRADPRAGGVRTHADVQELRRESHQHLHAAAPQRPAAHQAQQPGRGRRRRPGRRRAQNLTVQNRGVKNICNDDL